MIAAVLLALTGASGPRALIGWLIILYWLGPRWWVILIGIVIIGMCIVIFSSLGKSKSEKESVFSPELENNLNRQCASYPLCKTYLKFSPLMLAGLKIPVERIEQYRFDIFDSHNRMIFCCAKNKHGVLTIFSREGYQYFFHYDKSINLYFIGDSQNYAYWYIDKRSTIYDAQKNRIGNLLRPTGWTNWKTVVVPDTITPDCVNA